MTDPIISPWFIYFITRIDSIKCFLGMFPLIFMAVTFLIMILKGFAGEFDAYSVAGKENSRKYVKKVLKVGMITIPLAAMLNLFIPSTKVLATMYVADKLTVSNIQMVGETADKVVDKAVEKVIKVIEATKEGKKE